jgi:hypothetical protein
VEGGGDGTGRVLQHQQEVHAGVPGQRAPQHRGLLVRTALSWGWHRAVSGSSTSMSNHLSTPLVTSRVTIGA